MGETPKKVEGRDLMMKPRVNLDLLEKKNQKQEAARHLKIRSLLGALGRCWELLLQNPSSPLPSARLENSE